MTAVSTQVDSLNTTVSGLQTSITAIQTAVNGNNDQLETLASELENAQTAIASLTAQLENVNTAEELEQISSTLANVEADVHELLESDAVINQDIIIDSEATLQYAETLVSTGDDDPNVIVNGIVKVIITKDNFNADQIARVNAVTSKLATILKSVEISNSSNPAIAVELPNLSFIDSDYLVEGNNPNDDALRTISGNLSIHNDKAVDYSHLSNVGGNVSIGSEITSLNLADVDIKGDIYTNNLASGLSQGNGVIVLPKAVTVNVGTAKVRSASLTLATDIDFGDKGTLSSLAIQAPAAVTLDIAATAVSGNLDLSGVKNTATVNLNSLKTLSGTSNITAGHLSASALTHIANTTITANTVDLSALTSNASGTLTINTAKVLNAPKFITAQTVTGAALTDVTLASTSDALLVAAAAKNITLNALENTIGFNTTSYTALENFSLTGKVNDKPSRTNVNNMVNITGSSIKSVSIDGMVYSAVVSDTSALTSLMTSGNMRIFHVHNADKLASITIGHDHIDGSDEASLMFTDNAILTSVDLSSVHDVGIIEITDNPKLTAFTSPEISPLSEERAIISAIVTGNGLQGTYTAGTPFVQGTGTVPDTPATESSIVQASVHGLRLWLEAHYSHSSSPTFNIEIDAVDNDADGKFDEGDYATVAAADSNNNTDNRNNQIDIVAELNTVRKE